MQHLLMIQKARKKMAIRDNREYRMMSFEASEDNDFTVRGYASTFEPYCLFEDEGVQYMEQVDANAFDDTDLSDVIFLYNHEGMVYARQKNGTLNLSIDEHGLKVEADLSSTESSRQMYEQIRSGLVDQMSFAFVVDDDEYDQRTHTRIIKHIKKVYDVSAVSIPANPDTDIEAISARSYFDGFIEAEKTERLEREQRLALAKAKYNF